MFFSSELFSANEKKPAAYAPEKGPPTWEVFRQEGEGKRGDPVLTWEPEAEMLHTDAYKEWLERSAASRA